VGNQSRSADGHFKGPRRINVESVPRLPIFPVRWMLDDRRRLPYLVLWTSPIDDSFVLALRLETLEDGKAVRVSPPAGGFFVVRLVNRSMPRQRGTALLFKCPWCGHPRRHLYRRTRVQDKLVAYQGPLCRACAGLRWASHGAYQSVVRRAFLSALGFESGTRAPYPRHPWDPARAVSDPRILLEEFPNLLHFNEDAGGPPA
jgi:hypothetical protein